MELYKKKEIKRYMPVFKEAFGAGSELKVIEKVMSIISRRTGENFFVSPVPAYFSKSDEGNLQGIFALSSKGRMVRFNWKEGGNSSQILSIDYWKKSTIQPLLTLQVGGANIVKIIDIIESMLFNPQPDTYQFEEDAGMKFSIPKNLGAGNKQTSDSINGWFKGMNIDEYKLSNTRLGDLYKQSYVYWYNNVREDDFKLVSDPTFRNYLKASFEKNGITNIFQKNLEVRKASKEKSTVNSKVKDEFDKSTFAMTLQDTIEYLKASVRMVTRGHENAIVICGAAGVGKSKLVRDVLIDDGIKFKTISGGVKNTQALFEILKKNNNDHFVLVFDDVDDIFDKRNSDIMKAALAPGGDRIVSWYDAKYKDTSIKNVPQVHFKSSVIIISNKPKSKIPPAIISRTAPVEIKVGIPEMIDNLRINLKDVMPEVPVQTKEEVLNFIQDVVKDQIEHLDYRLFERCVIYKLSGYPEWKKFCLPILK